MGKTNKPKFDYQSPEFLTFIENLAQKGFTDRDIAWSLVAEFGENLSPKHFSDLKNEKDENGQFTEQAQKITEALVRGRGKINLLVRGTFLKTALGGKKTKNVSVVTRHIRDKDGNKTGDDEVQTTVTDIELPPNIQALSTWLFQFDPDWRQAVIEGKKFDTAIEAVIAAEYAELEKLIDTAPEAVVDSLTKRILELQAHGK